MSNLSGVTTNLIPTVNEGFATTIGGSGVASGDTIVPLTSVAGLTNGSIFVGIVEPGTATEQVFTGVVDSGSSRITSVKWTRGSNVAHAAGVTVVDYVTGTSYNMLAKAVATHTDQDGTLKAGAVDVSSVIADGIVTQAKLDTASATTLSTGWTPISGSISAVTYNGNRSYTLTTSSDNTANVSPGMRLRTTRTVSAPTQSASLNGSTQYFSKSSPAGMTFTDDFVVSAWVKLSSYAAGGIVSRINGTQGWQLIVNAQGQVTIAGFNGSLSNFSSATSYQSVPLNKWTHVTAQLDMSSFTATTTTSYIMFDGVDVPASVARAGTNPTALVQAGNFEVGSTNSGTLPFPGKIAQVAIYSAKVTQANIRATISQGLVGNETSLISAYSLSNSVNDLNANANNLTAQGSATTTDADAPWGGQASGSISATLDYSIVQAITSSSMTVQVAEGCTIPTSGGVSAVSYSSVKAPYGMPTELGKWSILWVLRSNSLQSSPTVNVWYNSPGSLSVPIGAWNLSYIVPLYVAGSGTMVPVVTLSTTNNSESSPPLSANNYATSTMASGATKRDYVKLSVQTPYYMNFRQVAGSVTSLGATFADTQGLVTAENAYL